MNNSNQMEFNTKATQVIDKISDVIKTLNDELVLTRVKLSDLELRVASLERKDK